MDWMRVLFTRCTALFRKRKLDADLDEELRAHIEFAIEENRKRGMRERDARTKALQMFGGVTQTREAYRSQQGFPFFESLARDTQYAVRQLLKSPIFAVTAILTLALGIGATTAIFTMMNAVLLRSLPVPNPQQLVYLHVPDGQPYGAFNTGDSETSFSLPVFDAMRSDRHAFSDVMAFVPLSDDGKVAVRVDDGEPEQISSEMVSGNFFSGLGVSMARGRGFSLDDEKQNAPVAVLSYAYWTRGFARNPAVLGQTIYVKGTPFTIVGIAAGGFPGVEPGALTDLWIPLQRRTELNAWGNSPDQTVYTSPNWWCLRLIARLAPGVTAQQAVAEATLGFQAAAYASLGTPDPQHPKVKLALAPAKGTEGLGDNYREPITILMALVILVLLIACSNVVMLIVARNASRQRDFSLRMALGAQRSTLLRQLMTESGLLVVSGTVLGWLFAFSAARALAAWAQLQVNLAPDGTILLFACTVSILSAFAFGLAPLRTATSAPVNSALRASASTSYQRNRGGSAVLMLQVALCFTLLVAAGLLVRTLLNYEHTNLGMDAQKLLVFGITPQKSTTNEARFAFYRALIDRMRVLPGVESATLLDNRLGSGWANNDEPIVDGVSYPFGQIPLRTNNVGPDFLHTLGIPLLEGRDIEDRDAPTSERVAIVNETFVKQLLPNTNPIGHHLGNRKSHPYTIVGVAKDSKYRSVDEKPRAMAYYPYTQNGDAAETLQVELRTAGNPLALLPSAERAVHELDPAIPLEKPMTQAAVFEDSYAQQRLFARLAMFFGLLAALLVGIGLYGTLSYRVSRRSTEIGVRMALGAQRRQVLAMVFRETFMIAAVGIAAGIPLALVAGHFMSSMLFGLQPYDPFAGVAALAGVAAISVLSGYLPAHRAASIDPMRALRTE
ncbi:MAG: ADOP family duplicated permease [Terracidiphilus sp.]